MKCDLPCYHSLYVIYVFDLRLTTHPDSSLYPSNNAIHFSTLPLKLFESLYSLLGESLHRVINLLSTHFHPGIRIRRAGPSKQCFQWHSLLLRQRRFRETFRTCLSPLADLSSKDQFRWYGVTNVHEYGEPLQQRGEPLGAYSFSYDPAGQHFYFASHNNVLRTDFDGTNLVNIVTETQYESIQSVVVCKQKVWYSTFHAGLIKRMTLDGSDVETFLNVSEGLHPIQWASSSARGIIIDDTNNFIYWSGSGGSDWPLPHRGSIRRARLQANTTAVEVLAQDIIYPVQMRLSQNGALYWGEANNTASALRRAYFAPDRVLQPGDTQIATMLSDKTHPELLSYPITGFALSDDEGKAWITAVDGYRNTGRIIEAPLVGGEPKLFIDNTMLTGLPIGVEYII